MEWTEEQVAWVKEYRGQNKPVKDIEREFNKQFKTGIGRRQIYECIRACGIITRTHYTYTKVMDNWLIANFDKCEIPELTRKFNKTFNNRVSFEALRKHCNDVLNLHHIRDFTPEEKEFMIQHKHLSYTEMTKLHNEKFQEQRTVGAMMTQGVKLKLGKQVVVYPDEVKMWITQNHARFETFQELTDELNKRFNKNYNQQRIRELCNKQLKIKKAAGGFVKRIQPGERNRSKKLQPVGTIREASGQVLIKYKDDPLAPDNWMPKKNYYYTQVYKQDEIGPDEIVITLDGNQHNCDKDNLLKVKRQEFCTLIKRCVYGNKELTLAMLDIIRCEKMIGEIIER